MRKTTIMTAMVTVFLATVLALTFTAGAAIGGFALTIEPPENQAEGVYGFFDLWVTPGQTQELTLGVRNGRDIPISVEMDINPAATGSAGALQYAENYPHLDDSLEYNIRDLVQFGDGTLQMDLDIPAGATAMVPLTLNVPQSGFDGMILGGVHVLLGITQEELDEGGMIVNRFAQVMPIRLRISDVPAEPDFALGYVRAEVVNYRASFVADIRHTAPRISRGALASMWVYEAGSDLPAMSHENMSVEFAPNAIMAFTLRDTMGYGIPPGDYRVRVRVEYDGQVWDFEDNATVTAAEARVLAEETIGPQTALGLGGAAGLSLSVPVIVAITLGGVLLLALIIFLIVRAKKKKSTGTQDMLKGVNQDELAKMLEQMRKQQQNNGD